MKECQLTHFGIDFEGVVRFNEDVVFVIVAENHVHLRSFEITKLYFGKAMMRMVDTVGEK